MKRWNSRRSISIDRLGEVGIMDSSNDGEQPFGPERRDASRGSYISNERKGEKEVFDEVTKDGKFSGRDRVFISAARTQESQIEPE